jgi:aspartyl-tRNA(Asn)/glutamyl-tRNA(Gln) amidotransferase subunit C
MSVSPKEVRAMATLARLRLDREEAERLAGDLNRILEHVDLLQTLDTASDPVLTEAAGQRPTDDEAAEATSGMPDRLHTSPEENAPAWDHGFFLVPPPEGVDPDTP